MKVQRVLMPIDQKGQWDEPEGEKRFAGFIKQEITEDIDGMKISRRIDYAVYVVPVKEDAAPKDKQ